MWTWSFVIVTFIQTVITLALECYIFANYQSQLKEKAEVVTASKTIPIFLALYSFGFLYELVLVYDALRMKNTIQVIGLCLCNIGLLIYGAVQVQQVKEAVSILTDNTAINMDVWGETEPFLIIIPCVVAMGTVLMVMVAWKLYDEFAWSIYKHISADLRMKRRYLTYQIYVALLKFDFFFFLGFTVQFVVIVTDKADIEFSLTLAAIPVTILILVCAAIFVRRESSIGMIIIIVCFLLPQPVFLLLTIRLASLLCSYGLFPIQACAHVPTRDLQGLPACPAVTHVLCCHHDCSHHHDYHQRLHVHAQFPQGSEAPYQQKKVEQGGGEDHRAVLECGWRDTQSNDD
jgi:hypothetical protein